MALFIVTTTADDVQDGPDAFNGGDLAAETSDGEGLSLREAVGLANAAPDPDEIMFDATVFGELGVVRLVGGPLEIAHVLAVDGDVDGDGDPDVLITGDVSANDAQASRAFTGETFPATDPSLTAMQGGFADNVTIFALATSAFVTIRGLALTGGSAADERGGGAVYAAESAFVTIESSLIAGNYAGPDARSGGGVRAGADGATAIRNSAIVDNLAVAPFAGGAGVASDGSLLIEDSLIADNVTTGDGGDGAGLLVRDAVSVNIYDSTFRGNRAEGGFADGGGLQLYRTDALLSGVTFEGNEAVRDGGGLQAGQVDATLINVTFTGNQAGRDGGGLELDGGQIDLVNATMTGNAAGRYGGGYVSLGASDSGDGLVSLANSIVLGNSAPAGGGEGTAGPGGAVSIAGPTIIGGELRAADGSITALGAAEDVAAAVFVQVDEGAGVASDNGGSVATVALLRGGPAVDAGDSDAFPPSTVTDARGSLRLQGGTIDLGAFEVADPDPAPEELNSLAVSLFDVAFYLGRGGNAPVLEADGISEPLEAFAHWVGTGFDQNLDYAPLLDIDALFDEAAYLRANPDVQAAIGAGEVESALDHYIRIGSALDTPNDTFGVQYNPNAFFDPAAYRNANPDIVAAVDFNGNPIDPFVHYLQFGEPEFLAEMRELDGLVGFDPRFYRTNNPDVAGFIDAGVDGNLGLITYFQHFVDFGLEEGRAGLPEGATVFIAEPMELI